MTTDGAPSSIAVLRDAPWPEAPADDAIRAAARAALPDGSGGELCVRLADDEAVRELNRRWRGVDAVTDVLAFPQQEPPVDPDRPLGDVALAVPFVRREAERLGRDPAAHLLHLVVHGALHLLGHDHAGEEERRAMRRREREIMRRLGLHDPWPEEDEDG